MVTFKGSKETAPKEFVQLADGIILKPRVNLFDKKTKPNPKTLLAGTDILVVMGQKTNMCVKSAAVGDVFNTSKKDEKPPDATQVLGGCQVWSSNKICNGKEDATWAEEANVTFSAKLSTSSSLTYFQQASKSTCDYSRRNRHLVQSVYVHVYSS